MAKNHELLFKREYPTVDPKHDDLEYFGWLRDYGFCFPQPWEVPEWFRSCTLLAAAEAERSASEQVVYQTGTKLTPYRRVTLRRSSHFPEDSMNTT
eukprot:4601993-Amphidinium_carterae.2